jgi:hypothetical protein
MENIIRDGRKWFLYTFLWIGVIFADFHLCVSLLSSIDLLNIFATGVVMLSIVSLSNFGCIESDPCDFVSFVDKGLFT